MYTGFTENLRQRLAEHNAGKSPHTKQYTPWNLETYLAFSDRLQALAFERYLKTASGTAFANKRLRHFCLPKEAKVPSVARRAKDGPQPTPATNGIILAAEVPDNAVDRSLTESTPATSSNPRASPDTH